MKTDYPANGMSDQSRFNPTIELLDLHNSHIVDWKWHLQESRPAYWWRFRCWAFTSLSSPTK
ncbi:hypothetical protein [Pseudomonas sp. PS02290]|uniref:hypothetical protein n=1 Tax=Pseudomonas sp. PS02290 TaxID=2991430 RepID=UPI00249BF807|nr:hypothetical protein [Pseudomonas sp. PS02290]